MAKSNGDTDGPAQEAPAEDIKASDPVPAEAVTEPAQPKAAAFKSAEDIKAWVRKELHLLWQGHSEETRIVSNP